MLSGSTEAFDEVFGSFSSVRSHSPVLIATVTTTSDSIAERPEAIPRPPPPPPLFAPTTILPPDAPVTTPPALEEPGPPRLSQHQQQQDITTCLPFVMGTSQHWLVNFFFFFFVYIIFPNIELNDNDSFRSRCGENSMMISIFNSSQFYGVSFFFFFFMLNVTILIISFEE